MLGGYPKQHSIKEINKNEFSSKSSLRSDVLRKNSSIHVDLTLSNSYSRVLVLGYPLTIRTSISRSILYLEDQDLLVNVREHNRQLLHENSSVQLQFVRYKVSGITGTISVWTGTDYWVTGTVTFHTLGWTATRLPPRVVIPSQRSAFAVDSRYATRSTSSSIADTAASYSSLEHGLDLLAGSPVYFPKVSDFPLFVPKMVLEGILYQNNPPKSL